MQTKKRLFFLALLLGLCFLYACNNQQQKKENQKPVTENIVKVVDKDIQEGRHLFDIDCSGCHKTNKEFWVGSGLCNVTKRRTKEWLFSYTRNPMALLAAADSTALALFRKNKTQMLSYPTYTDKQLESLYKYIDYMNCKDEFDGQWSFHRKKKK